MMKQAALSSPSRDAKTESSGQWLSCPWAVLPGRFRGLCGGGSQLIGFAWEVKELSGSPGLVLRPEREYEADLWLGFA
jgi:hypothetical protein